ncbi:pikachurin-like isoform X1 [Centruroides sculpturatus]|uniref:pikachurin-like isoform X1 n=2 Tax=Centruroides sculpturatus TaxID=218467 RepID=UPI000C6CA509|nr:pikachurin-like isoform X1 [Centruroides sculpturatus]
MAPLAMGSLVILFITILVGSAKDTSFEAAFQGHCGEESPCQHFCYDLHDGTYECSCRDGYNLSEDGYSCVEIGNSRGGRKLTTSSADQLQNEKPVSDEKDIYYRPYQNEDIDDSNDVHIFFDVNHLDGKKRSGHRIEDPYQPMNTLSVTTPSTRRSCDILLCESGGICIQDEVQGTGRCRCPLGRGGTYCEQPLEPRYPRFKNGSYLILPVLREAYKSMQVTIEFRPESYEGILMYSGEKSNLQGDYIAIVLNKGFVEFRFDCGMGEGILKSDQPVVLHSWNMLSIFRDGWDAWMQLNNGKQIQGRSRGLFSRITFRQNLYLGGSPNISLVKDRLLTSSNFIGCIRNLEINSHIYDFRPVKRGDSLQGVDIEECNADVCSQIICHNGGQCVAASPDHGICLCPIGFIGEKCETPVDIIIPSFNGSSYLQYPGLANTVLSFIEVLIVFKPYVPNGVLFYNGYKMDGSGDFISINLVNGFVELRFDLGTGVAIIRSSEPISMNEWHTVFISRTGRDGILEVDKQAHVEGMSPGAFTQLSLPLNLYVGGVPDFQDTARKAAISTSFNGCIQKLVINSKPLKLLEEALSGVNIGNCEHSCVNSPCHNGGSCEPKHDFYTCHCLLGYTGINCEKEGTEIIAEPMFTGASYLHYIDDGIMKRIRGNKVDIKLKFRSFAQTGLILWAGKNHMTASSDFLTLGIRDSYLYFQYNLGSGEVTIVQNSTKVDDGKWHSLHAIRHNQEGSLIIDNSPAIIGKSPGPLHQLNVNNGLYLGGMEDIVHLSQNHYKIGMVGCLANFTLSTDYHVHLIIHATSGINIQQCL